MKKLKYNLITAFIIIVWVFSCNGGFAQTYNPAQGTVSNKPYAPAQATPTDSRSYFYDGTNFIWRPYQSTTEILSYLNLSKYRTGNFSIYVNPTGTLNGDGTFTGGFIAEYWFKNGTANGNLVLKTDSTKANQQALIDTASSIRSILSSRFNPIAGTNITITGTYPNITFNSSGGSGSVSISANSNTGAWVSPSPIIGTGTVGIDTTKIATRLYMLKAVDSMQIVPDTLVIKNSPTSGYGLAYPNINNDTAFFKRLIQGYGALIVQNTDSSLAFKVDTSNISTIAQLQKRLNDALLGGSITGTGTANLLPKFLTASTVGNSVFKDSLGYTSIGANTYPSGSYALRVGQFNAEMFDGSSKYGDFTTTATGGTLSASIARTASSGLSKFDLGGLAYFSANSSTGEVRNYASNGGYFPTFYSNGGEAARITTTSNYLIGTTTDNAIGKLQVEGKVTIGTASNGASTDSILVINAKEVKKISQSSIGGGGSFSPKIRVSDNADITVASDDYTIVLKNSTTNKNVTLPSAASSTNRILRFINTGTSTFTFDIAVRTNASTTFTVSTAIYSIEIQSDGTDWWLINNYLR